MDYNIYIRQIDGGSTWEGGKTSPSTMENSPTVPWNPSAVLSSVTPSTPENVLGQAQGFMRAGGSATPWLLAAAIAAKACATAMKTGMELTTITSGDYNASIAYSNFMTFASNLLHPLSSTLQHYKTVLQIKQEDDRRRQYVALLGDAEINQITGRGI